MLLFLGISAMVAVGLSWIILGVIMGRLEQDRIKPGILLFYSGLSAVAVSTVIVACNPVPSVSPGLALFVAGTQILCGMLNNRQLYYLSRAMACGPNGIIWSITQSGFIVPFLAGVIFFSVPLTVWRSAGAVVLLIAIFCMGFMKDNQQAASGRWRYLAFLTFGITGLSQTLSNLPSYYPAAQDTFDSYWRTLFFSTGLMIGTPLMELLSGQWKEFSRNAADSFRRKRLWIYVLLILAVEMVGSFYLLYPGMDMLAEAGAGAIAYPLMVGSCIVGFEVYSLAVLREKQNWIQLAALLLCLFGAATICC